MTKCNEIISKMTLYDNDDELKGSKCRIIGCNFNGNYSGIVGYS